MHPALECPGPSVTGACGSMQICTPYVDLKAGPRFNSQQTLGRLNNSICWSRKPE